MTHSLTDSPTLHRLVLEKVAKTDEGSYCCRISNDLNILFSNWVVVAVHEPIRGNVQERVMRYD